MARAHGTTLETADGSYRIHEVVAVGGFASVYFGRNLKTNVPVAVKMLHPHHISDARVVRHFINEAVLARGLRHPNVVGVVDQGQAEDGQPFIVMEWMTGWTVAALIGQRGALAAGEAAFIAEQTLRALSAAHARQIYHRDIKPANIMLTADGAVKVMDFGISKDASLSAASGASGVMGTPAYMAPEQFRGEMADGRTDLYAVGVTLYQMLVGKVPFESTSTHGLMYQHLEKPPPPLRATRPDLPPALEDIVKIALEKAPERRFQSADAMATALAPFSSQGVALPSRLPDGTIVSPVSSPIQAGNRPTEQPSPAVPPGSATLPGSPPNETHSPLGAPGRVWNPNPGPAPRPPSPATSPPTQPTIPLSGSGLTLSLLGLAAALLVFGALVGGYLLLERQREAAQPPVTPTPIMLTGPTGPPTTPPAIAEAKPAAPDAKPAGPETGPAVAPPSPNQDDTASARCSSALLTAANQRQHRALAEAATTLESARSQSCIVSEPLYEIYLEHGRDLADAERMDEAITRFDLALQLKSGDEARNARTLAATYREGRGALERRNWDEAVEKLDAVHRASSTYARGNVKVHLAAGLVAKGDDFRRQNQHEMALDMFRRADQVKPNDAEIAARIRDTEDAQSSKRVAEAAAREPTQTPTLPPPPAKPQAPAATAVEVEHVAYEYYRAINDRQYQSAYALLSAQARQQQTLAQFQARFVNTRGISVRWIEGTRIDGSTSGYFVHTQTVNTSPQGDVTACSRVQWALVREPEGWRRDVVSGSGNEQGERC